MPALATRICPVETREELLYLLTRASELEHDLACSYLYAGYSIKSQPGEGGLTFDEHVGVRRWKQKIAQVAVEEMLHLAQVSNILTAVGGAPHFVRGTFPLPASTFPFGIEISLEPLSQALIERFVCYEMPHEGVLSAQEMAQFDEIRHRQVVDEDRIELARQQNAIEPFDIDFRTVGEFYKRSNRHSSVITRTGFSSATRPCRQIRAISICPKSSCKSWTPTRPVARSI